MNAAAAHVTPARLRGAGVILGVIAAQGVASALSLFTGLWVVRSLPTGEYALYTLATSVLGTMVLLADTGIAAGATALGGRCWRDKTELGAVMNTALRLRSRRAWQVAGVALPVLAVLLLKSGAGAGDTALWLAAVAFAFAAGLGQLIWEIPLRLHEALRITQRTTLLQAGGRALLTVVALTAWPAGVCALVATGAAQLWASLRLGRAGHALVNPESPPREELRAAVQAVVKRAFPGAAYTVLTQQFGLWFLSLAGTTLAVAQYGALSRIAVLVGVIVSVNQILFAPRFARIEQADRLPGAYARYLGIIFALCLPLNLVAWLAPDALLLLVGSNYAGIGPELRLAVAAATLQAVGGSGFVLGYARGWHMPPVLGIATMLAVQIACVTWLDLETLRGALLMGVCLGLHQIVVNVGYCRHRIRHAARDGCGEPKSRV